MVRKLPDKGKRESLSIPPERWLTIEKALRLRKVGNYKKNAWYVEIIFNEAERIVAEDERRRRSAM